MLKLGYKASAEQFGPRELLEFSCLAEAVGFDSVFVSDHFQPWKHTGGHAPYSFAWLGALGAKTNRVQIGTSVATPPSVTIPRSWRRQSARSVRCFRTG